VIEKRVHELLELVQLSGLSHRYPHQLSGGQRQRVALARALAVEPRVLLLDEPFGALDAKVRQDLRRWLRNLHEQIQVTSVFVTHDQDEALEVADRVVVMNRGKIEQVGSPDEVFHKPATSFVMNFLGNVNRFRGRIEAGKAVFGKLVLDGSSRHESTLVDVDQADGKRAELFVRPHDLMLSPNADDQPGFLAAVVRVQSAGPVVRVELADEDQSPVFVDVPHDQFDAAIVAPGRHLKVGLRRSHLFVQDYQI
jgi:sulfate/thiosulfate transport system ATP-binding protein